MAAPSSILANALTIDLGVDAVAALQSGEFHFFSSAPTKAQRPLGRKASALIGEFEQAEKRLADLLPDQAPSGRFGGLLDDVYARQSLSDSVGKVLLNVFPRGRIVSFYTHVYGKSGRLRSWGLAGTYYMGDDPWTREKVAGAGKTPTLARLSEGSIALDRIAPLELDRAFLSEELPKQSWNETTETQRKILLNPETIDPLSLHVTDACFELASRKSQNLIAYLSDDMVRAGRIAAKDESIDLARFQAIATANGASFQSDGSWFVIQPKSVLSATEGRMPRSVLGAFLRLVVATGRTELEPLSRLHYESKDRTFGSVIVRMYRNAIRARGFPPLHGEESHGSDVYCALGSLSTNQWRTLRRGDAIGIGRMPEFQRSAAARWMRQSPYLQTDPRADVPDIFKQPSEFAPLGLPSGSTLSSVQNERLVLRSIHKITRPDGTSYEGSMDPIGRTVEQITGGYARGGYYKSIEHFANSIRKSKFEYALRNDETFRLQILPTHWIEETFLGVPQEPKIAEFDKLPEPIRNEIIGAFERQFRERGS